MDIKNVLSRRHLLKAAPAAAAVAIVPGTALATAPFIDPETEGKIGLPLAAVHIERAIEALADASVWGRWSVTIVSGNRDQTWFFKNTFKSEVALAVAAYRFALTKYDEARDAAGAIEDALAQHPSYQRFPKVQYGRYHQVSNVETGEGSYEPLYARSTSELDALCERDCRVWENINPNEIPRVQAKYADLKRQLVNAKRRTRRLEAKLGLPSAEKAITASIDRLTHCTLELMLAKPRDNQERAQKAAFMRDRKNVTFQEGWFDGDELMAALLANSRVL